MYLMVKPKGEQQPLVVGVTLLHFLDPANPDPIIPPLDSTVSSQAFADDFPPWVVDLTSLHLD